MNFKEFFLLNELFGDFNYVLPEDKEQQLYDFYMLSFLKGRSQFDRIGQANRFNYGQIRKPYDDEMDQEDKLDFMLKEVEKTLIPELKQNLLDAVFYSLAAEIRHIFDAVGGTKFPQIDDIVYDDLGPEYSQILNSYKNNYYGRKERSEKALNKFSDLGEINPKNTGYHQSYDALINTGATEETIVKLMHYLFKTLRWDTNYGGKAWANIANGWLKLNNAKTEAENFIYIDHIYDLQHNTDTVFNKLKSYTKKGSHSWIRAALDHKRDIKEPHEIIDLVSPKMKRLALRVIKMKFGKTYEDFIKEKEKNSILGTFGKPHNAFNEPDELERERRTREEKVQKQIERYEKEVEEIEGQYNGWDLCSYYVSVEESDNIVYVSMSGKIRFILPMDQLQKDIPTFGSKDYNDFSKSLRNWAKDNNIYGYFDYSQNYNNNLEIDFDYDNSEDSTPKGFDNFLYSLKEIEEKKDELRASFYQLMINLGYIENNEFNNHLENWEEEQFKYFDWDHNNYSITISAKQAIPLIKTEKPFFFGKMVSKDFINHLIVELNKWKESFFINQNKQKLLFPKTQRNNKPWNCYIEPDLYLNYISITKDVQIQRLEITLKANDINEHIKDAIEFIHFIDNNYEKFIKIAKQAFINLMAEYNIL
mgnify:CR=1 FL=1